MGDEQREALSSVPSSASHDQASQSVGASAAPDGPGRGSGETGLVSSPWAKFAVGCVAGFAAAVLPRFVAQLTQSDIAQITFFPQAYLIAAVVFALFMGALMTIFEWKLPAKPRDTFMSALALPAVVAGAIGTASGVGTVNEVKKEADRLKQEISAKQGIQREGSILPFEPIGPAAPSRPPTGSWIDMIVRPAYAQVQRAPSEQGTPVQFGIRLDEPRYAVILHQSATKQDALDNAERLRLKLPEAQAVKSGNGYYVLMGGAKRSETDALLEATRAKSVVQGLNPRLVEIRQ